MSLFFSEKAPYVLVTLMAVAGWLFTNTIDETKDRVFLHFEIGDAETGGERFVELALQNQSVSLPLKGLNIELRCKSRSQCFRPLSSAGGTPVYLTSVAVPPWSISVRPDGTAESQTIMPVIPAGARLVVRAGLQKDMAEPEVFFSLSDVNATVPELTTGISLYNVIFRNYILILLSAVVAVVALILIWLFWLEFKGKTTSKSGSSGSPDEMQRNLKNG